MKIKCLILGICATVGLASCDETTGSIGSSLIGGLDNLQITTDTFNLKTRSIAAGSVLARNTTSYLGTVRDPETGEYLTANYMTQFHTLEDYTFPELEKITSRDANGDIVADSCEIRIFWDTFYGDSLTSMKCTAYELSTPMKENITYYSDFDPKAEGLLRGANEGGVIVSKNYTLEDMTVDRPVRDDTGYSKNIRIMLNKPYTDKDGKTYNNYGTYIMRKYYKEYGGNPENFKNSIMLTNEVIPGFYIESTGGIGCIANVSITQLNIYFTYQGESADKPYTGTTSFAGTQEVMQRTNFANQKEKIDELVADNSCTYLKTPSGIFTEITIPVDEICFKHDNDTINSAKFSLQRINNTVNSKYALDAPQTVLLIPRDSLNTFFEHKNIANYKTSYLATFDASKNIYTFNNIGTMVKAMQQAKLNGEASENWNKAVIVPVTTTYNASSELSKVVHNMALTSTKLIGGENNPNGDIRISVIYSKYE